MAIKKNAKEIEKQSGLMLEDIRDIERHCREISRLVNMSRGYWEGDAAEAHIRMYEDAMGDMEEATGSILKDIKSLRKEMGICEEESERDVIIGDELPTDVF